MTRIMSKRQRKKRSPQRRTLLEQLEGRLLLSATTPDDVTIATNTVDYRAGGLLIEASRREATINGSGQAFIDLSINPSGDQTHRLTTDQSSDRFEFDSVGWRDNVLERFLVDPAIAYRFEATTFHVPDQVGWELGYAPYDADGLLVSPIHVRKFPGASDTLLTLPINPGDETIVVDDATGWSNDPAATNRSRTLAWYGYQDALGTTYDDYTYTRNVLGDEQAGAWRAGGISFDPAVGGYRIELNEPWSGNAVPAGTAIRNAVSDQRLLQFPTSTYDAAFREDIARLWYRYEKVSGWSDFGGHTWDAERSVQPAIPPGVASIQLSSTTLLVDARMRPAGDETEAGPTLATFDGNLRFVADRSIQMIESDLPITVDPTQSYTLSLFASVQPTDDVPTPVETHSLGYVAYDSDGLPIKSEHVEKHAGAADTVLAQDLRPGDLTIELADATGWSTAAPATRTLAWYGYSSQSGATYSDFTYTRNTAGDSVHGLWSIDGVVGNRLLLNEPWSGPELLAGSAVRNAVAGSSLVPAVIADSNLSVAGSRLTSNPVSGFWQNGNRQLNAFPPGTASIRPAGLLNQSNLQQDDLVVLESFAVSQPAFAPITPSASTQQYHLQLDVSANDSVGQSPSVSVLSVSPPQYGDATVGPGGVVLYTAPSWFFGTDQFEYTLFDALTSEQWQETVTVTVLGSNLHQDAAAVDQLAQNPTVAPAVREIIGNDEADVQPSLPYRVGSGQTLTADGFSQNTLFDRDGVGKLGPEHPVAASLTRGPLNGSLSFSADGTFEYVPEEGFVGTDTFEYSIFDGLRTDTAVAQIEVYANTTDLVLANLHALTLGMHNYHSAYKQLPVIPTSGYQDENGIPHLSWRVHLLPFLGYQGLYDQFNLDEPWHSPHNFALASKMPDLFGDGLGTSSLMTRIQLMRHEWPPEGDDIAITGFRADWTPTRFRDVLDGLSQTIMMIQTGADRAVPWTAPQDQMFDTENPLNTLGEISADGILVSMFDGQTAVLPADIQADVFKSLATRSEYLDEPYVDAHTLFRQTIDDGDWEPVYGDWDAGGERQTINLKRIGLGFHNYHSAYKQLPPNEGVVGRDENGNYQLSWRVYLLPFLGYSNLWERFHYDEPWDSPHNLSLLDEMPDVFRSEGDSADSNTTRFRTFWGNGALYGYNADGSDRIPRFRDILDGLANTAMAVEAGPDAAVPWTKPDEIQFDPSDPLGGLGTLLGDAFRVLLSDGSQINLPTDVNPETFAALVTKSGREPLDTNTLKRKHSDLNRPDAQRDQSNDLKKVGLAFHNYHSAYKRLPILNESMLDDDGRPLLSWRVYLLPFLEQQALWEQFHLDEPWDSPHNLSLLPLMPDVYRSVGDSWDSVTTRLQTFIDGGTPEFHFRNGAPFSSTGLGPRFRDFLDGLANTILVAESGDDAAVLWTKPDDILFDRHDPYGPLGNIGEGFHTLRADGAVIWERAGRDPERLNQLILHNDRNPHNARSNAVPNQLTVLESDDLGRFDVRITDLAIDNLDLSEAFVVEVAVEDPTLINVFPNSLTFDHSNWNIERSITFQAIDNDEVDGPRTTTITIGDQDFEITIVDDEGPLSLDYGDAPDSLRTLHQTNGARHVASGPQLGASRDAEVDGQPTLLADGDGSDDDGVMFGEIHAGNALAGVNVDLQGAGSAKVDAWIDFNADGQFSANERILDSAPLVAGLQTLNFAVPSGAVVGETYARVRVSTAGGLGSHGLAWDGEVEDYRVQILGPRPNVAQIVINDGNDQRSSLTQVAVAFDNQVNVGPGAFAIRRADNGQLVEHLAVSSSLVDGNTVSVITFLPGTGVVTRTNDGHTLADGDYILDIVASQITTVDHSVAMESDLEFGTHANDDFFRRYGDGNGNGTVDLFDFASFRSTYGKEAGMDGYLEHFNAEGVAAVNLFDFAAFRTNFGS